MTTGCVNFAVTYKNFARSRFLGLTWDFSPGMLSLVSEKLLEKDVSR